MSSRFVLEGLALGLAVAPSIAAARLTRRRWAPSLDGAERILADVTLSAAAVLLVAHVVGVVGQLRLPAMLIGGLVLLAVARRGASRRGQGTVPAPVPPARPSRADAVAFTVAAAAVGGQWGTRVVDAYRRGITDYDSLHYHLPFAARWVDEHRIGALHYANATGVPNVFHPADSEIFHALGMLAFGNDLASPLFNVAWAALGILAAWCIGRPFGVASASAVGFLVVLALPITSLSAGSALSDVPSYACLLASVAFLGVGSQARDPDRLRLAAISAGLGIGMKLTILAPVGLLTLGVLWIWRSDRRAWLLHWAVPLGVVGGFWYVRNLIATGSPVPGLDLPGLPHASFASVERYGFSVAGYLDDPEVIRGWFVPGAAVGISRVWPILLAAVAAVAIGLVLRPKAAIDRVLGIVVLATGGAYLVTPTSAFGLPDEPSLFALNIRYVFPVVALSLAILPVLARRWLRPAARWVPWLLAALAAAGVVGGAPRWPGLPPSISPWARGEAAAGFAIAAGVAVALVVGARARRRAWLALGLGALLIVGAAAEEQLVARRFATDPVARFTAERAPTSIGLAGFDLQYQLYGPRLDNEVDYLGERGPHGGFAEIDSCAAWSAALQDGGYELVVLPQEPPAEVAQQLEWTAALPSATEVLRASGRVVYMLDPVGPRAQGC